MPRFLGTKPGERFTDGLMECGSIIGAPGRRAIVRRTKLDRLPPCRYGARVGPEGPIAVLQNVLFAPPPCAPQARAESPSGRTAVFRSGLSTRSKPWWARPSR